MYKPEFLRPLNQSLVQFNAVSEIRIIWIGTNPGHHHGTDFSATGFLHAFPLGEFTHPY